MWSVTGQWGPKANRGAAPHSVNFQSKSHIREMIMNSAQQKSSVCVCVCVPWEIIKLIPINTCHCIKAAVRAKYANLINISRFYG